MRKLKPYSKAMKITSKALIYSALLKLKVILAIGVLISLSACTGYTLHSSEGVPDIPTYPVIRF